MSNVKEVQLIAKVPFNWMDEMEEADAAFLSKIFFTPSIGLTLNFKSIGWEEHGHGKTAMYMAEVEGQEALGEGYLSRIQALFERYGHVYKFVVVDIEANETLVFVMRP